MSGDHDPAGPAAAQLLQDRVPSPESPSLQAARLAASNTDTALAGAAPSDAALLSASNTEVTLAGAVPSDAARLSASNTELATMMLELLASGQPAITLAEFASFRAQQAASRLPAVTTQVGTLPIVPAPGLPQVPMIHPLQAYALAPILPVPLPSQDILMSQAEQQTWAGPSWDARVQAVAPVHTAVTPAAQLALDLAASVRLNHLLQAQVTSMIESPGGRAYSLGLATQTNQAAPSATPTAIPIGPYSNLTPFSLSQGSVSAREGPMPEPFRAELTHMSPADIRTRMERIFIHMQRRRASLSELPDWFHYTSGMTTWVVNLLAARPSITTEAFTTSLVSYCTGQVRPQSVLALEQLITGQITQGSDSAPQYASRFLNIARVLPNETQDSLCKHYITGLTPALRVRSCLTRENKEWTDLMDLMQFSYSEEYRMSLDTTALPPSMPAREGFRHHNKWGKNNAGRHKPASSTDGTVATITAPAAPAATPPGARAKLSPHVEAFSAANRKAIFDTAPVPELVAKHISQCPVKSAPGQHLTPAERIILKQWGICAYCRIGRHPRPCPNAPPLSLRFPGPPYNGKRRGEERADNH